MRPSVRLMGHVATPAVRMASAASPTASLTMIGWHRIGDAPDGLTTSFDDFRRHLDTIEAWGGTVLDLDEACRLLTLGQLPQRAVVLTFDDGYASVVEQAWPELVRRRMPATLYVVSGYLAGDPRFPWDHGHAPSAELTRLVNAPQLVEAVEEGLDVGSHTVTHRWLPGLAQTEIVEEVTASKAALEDLLQQEMTSFSYPMGGYHEAIRTAVQDAGYTTAITTQRGRNRRRHDPLMMRRAFCFDRADDVRRQLDGAYTWMRGVERTRRHREPTW